MGHLMEDAHNHHINLADIVHIVDALVQAADHVHSGPSLATRAAWLCLQCPSGCAAMTVWPASAHSHGKLRLNHAELAR